MSVSDTDEKAVLIGLANRAINLPMDLGGMPRDLQVEYLTAFREELAAFEKSLEDPEIREAVGEIAEIVEDRLRRDFGA